MKLLIDIGNTSAKLAVMNAGIVHFERKHESWNDTFRRILSEYSISDVRLSSVAGEDASLQAALDDLGVPVIRLTSATSCPVKPVVGIPLAYGSDFSLSPMTFFLLMAVCWVVPSLQVCS